MTYPELQNLIQKARSGNRDSAVDLAQLYKSGYAHIVLTEAIRQFHSLLFKTIALQLSQGLRPLLDKVPEIAETVNRYKDNPSLRCLNTVLDTLLASGRKFGDEVLTKISILISRSFQTLAKEQDGIINRLMPEYSAETLAMEEVTAFKERPNFKRLVEEVKELNTRFKSISDKKRSRSMMLYAANLGSSCAVKFLSESYNMPPVTVIPGRQLNNSLLGRSYDVITVWNKAREFNSFPV